MSHKRATATKSAREVERLRVALEEVIAESQRARHGETDTAWRAIGAVQAVACRALGRGLLEVMRGNRGLR